MIPKLTQHIIDKLIKRQMAASSPSPTNRASRKDVSINEKVNSKRSLPNNNTLPAQGVLTDLPFKIKTREQSDKVNQNKLDADKPVPKKPIPRVNSMPKMAVPLKSVLKAPTSQAMFLMK